MRRYFAGHAALVTGIYTVGFNAGDAIAAGATVGLENLFDGNWPAALAFWALLALPAAALWLKIVSAPQEGVRPTPSRPTALPWRSRRAWLLSAFFATSACLYWFLLRCPARKPVSGLRRS